MKYCSNCGHKIENDALFCLNCGVKLRDEISTSSNQNVDTGGFVWSLLGFFVPMAGLILYIVWRNEKPKTSNAAGKGALAYLIFCVILFIIMFVFAFVFGVNEENNYNNSYYRDDYYNDLIFD